MYDYGNDDSTGGKTTDDFTAAYEYDLANNRVEKTLDKSNDGTINESTAYSYVNPSNGKGGDDRLYSTVPTASGTTMFAYDNNGSMTSIAVTPLSGSATHQQYFYDARNRFVRFDPNGDTTYSNGAYQNTADDTTYAYDDDGARVNQTAGSAATSYVIDSNNPSGYGQILEEHQGASVTATYVLGLPGVIAQNVGGTVSYLVPDGHGSIRLLTSTSGSVVGESDYDAFGTAVTLSSAAKPWTNAATSEYGFDDESWNSITKTYLLGENDGRDLRPDLDRFTTGDPIAAAVGDWANANRYVFVGGNPTNAIDPSGQFLDSTGFLVANSAGATVDSIGEAGVAEAGTSLGEIVLLLGLTAGLGGLALWAVIPGGDESFGYAYSPHSPGYRDIYADYWDAQRAQAALTKIQQSGEWYQPNRQPKEHDSVSVAEVRRRGYQVSQQQSFIPIYYLPLDEFPEVGDHDLLAMKRGQPQLLRYNGGGSAKLENRAAAKAHYVGPEPTDSQDLDEYPYATAMEGGAGADVMPIDRVQNQLQGTDIGQFYSSLSLSAGSYFWVVVVPTRPFIYY